MQVVVKPVCKHRYVNKYRLASVATAWVAGRNPCATAKGLQCAELRQEAGLLGMEVALGPESGPRIDAPALVFIPLVYVSELHCYIFCPFLKWLPWKTDPVHRALSEFLLRKDVPLIVFAHNTDGRGYELCTSNTNTALRAQNGETVGTFCIIRMLRLL